MNKKTFWIGAVLLSFVVLAACSKEKTSDSSSLSKLTERLISQSWEEVSRTYRVQGSITKSTLSEDNKLISLSLDKIKNMAMNNNPIDYDFEGKTLDVFVKGEGLDKTVADKLKVGTDIVLTFAQHAIADKTSGRRGFLRIIARMDLYCPGWTGC